MAKYEGTLESVQQHRLPQWFDDAKFGLFIHWYPASVPAYAPLTEDLFAQTAKYGDVVAFTESPYAEWYVNSLAIEGSSVQKHHAEVYGNKPYDEFVDEFFVAAQEWDPDDWADVFAQSHAKYIVMGTRHIDGAIMWPTERHNPFKGPRYTSPRDLVGEACDAARSVGMRAGLYYCGGLDLTFQGLGYNGWLSMLMATPQSDEYKQYATAHYMELIDRYSPDLLWNDVGWPGGGAGALQLMADYYNINENGVVNDRFDMIGVVQGSAHCDYITPEYSSGLTAPGRKFEVCRGIGMSFGYNQLDDETTYASAAELIHLLINSVADGGNLLLNIGPKANGEIPDIQKQRLIEIGQWLEINGEAIFDSHKLEKNALTTSDGSVVRLTQGTDGATYAMILATAQDSFTISGLPLGVVELLGSHETVQRDGDVVILPAQRPQQPAVTLRIS
jgi:alpha-L-fucosidase